MMILYFLRTSGYGGSVPAVIKGNTDPLYQGLIPMSDAYGPFRMCAITTSKSFIESVIVENGKFLQSY